MHFDYDAAFSRNLGLVTAAEQSTLRRSTVAIAGMGGVGGVHLQTLARMGVQNFHIADMDKFELANCNRQVGATISTLNRPKTEVMREAALDINPECTIKIFADGVNKHNLDEFLSGADVYLDGLDFFALDIRAHVFSRCRERGIPAVTAGPIGLSTAYLVFGHNEMSFEEYFQLEGHSDFDKAVHFLVGLTPALAQRNHFVDYKYVNFSEKRGASLSVACQAASAVAGTEVFKLLLGRGKINYAPWVMQFDMLNNRYHKKYNIWGNRNPLNKLKIRMLKERLQSPP